MGAHEIERKFLVAELPAPEALGPGVALRQGYLARDGDVEVRLRRTADAEVLTVKTGGGLRRVEVERALAPDEAEALWPATAGRRIEKVRHRVALDAGVGVGGLVAEVDVYAGALDGLVVAEVELPDEGAAARFTPPAWFGRELTGEPGWSNASLAVHGRPA